MDDVKEELEVPPAPPETANEDEKQLIQEYALLKTELEELQKVLKVKNERLEAIDVKLISMLEADEKKSSARYQGLGHVTIIEGKVYASISKGMQDEVIKYLKDIGRDDMVKTTVNSSTLTSYVNQCLKQNEPIPPGVTHYRPKWIGFYPAK